MLTIVADNQKTGIISLPAEELEKLGFADGEEVEISKNENDEIILRSKQTERRKKILQATREIIEERRSALIELGKGHE